MSRIKKILVIALFMTVILTIAAGALWVVLDPQAVERQMAIYRARWDVMWNSGVYQLAGVLFVVGGLIVLIGNSSSGHASSGRPSRRVVRREGGPLGGSHVAEAMLLDKHYENPVVRIAARKIRDMIF